MDPAPPPLADDDPWSGVPPEEEASATVAIIGVSGRRGLNYEKLDKKTTFPRMVEEADRIIRCVFRLRPGQVRLVSGGAALSGTSSICLFVDDGRGPPIIRKSCPSSPQTMWLFVCFSFAAGIDGCRCTCQQRGPAKRMQKLARSTGVSTRVDRRTSSIRSSAGGLGATAWERSKKPGYPEQMWSPTKDSMRATKLSREPHT